MSLWIAGIGTAASIGFGAYSLANSGGGGGGGFGSGATKAFEEGLRQLSAAIEAGRANVSSAVAGMNKSIQKGVKELRDASDAETKAFWNNLGLFNESLINSASALVQTYDGDVMQALESLKSTVSDLNQSYAKDMGAEIERYGSIENAINAKLAESAGEAKEAFLSRVSSVQESYKQNTFQEAEDTKQEIFGEADKFQVKADAARQSYLDDARASEGYFKEEGAQDLAAREAASQATQNQYSRDMLFEAQNLEGKTQSLGDQFLTSMSGALLRNREETAALRRELASGTPTVDSEAEARRSLAFNTENAARFGALADTLSKAASQTRMDLLATADPRALELSAIADENAAAMMSGRISSDVQANLAKTAAMQALGGGFSGGAMQRNLEARDLGLTSLDLMNQGTEMYDAQRRLNYDTRVAGTQVNPFDVMQNNGLSTQQALATAGDNAARTQQSRIASAEIGAGAINARLGAEGQTYQNALEAGRLGTMAASDVRTGAYTNIFDTRGRDIADIYNQQRSDSLQRFSSRNDVLNTNLGTQLSLAEANRNVRMGAISEASNQRLQTYDSLFGSQLSTANAIREQDLTLLGQLSDQARDANIRSTGMRIGATQDIYNNTLGLSDTIFNTTTGLAGQKFQTGLSLVGDIYKTNVSGAGKTYDTRLGLENNIFGVRGNAAVAGMQAQAAYEAAALQANAALISGNTATAANMPVINAAMANGRAQASAQLWGSAFQAGSSLAGSYLGNKNWNPGARSYGGGFASQSNTSYGQSLRTPVTQGGTQYNAWFNQ